jgi:hypothetical protein
MDERPWRHLIDELKPEARTQDPAFVVQERGTAADEVESNSKQLMQPE